LCELAVESFQHLIVIANDKLVEAGRTSNAIAPVWKAPSISIIRMPLFHPGHFSGSARTLKTYCRCRGTFACNLNRPHACYQRRRHRPRRHPHHAPVMRMPQAAPASAAPGDNGPSHDEI
jgi:hypothetical protein